MPGAGFTCTRAELSDDIKALYQMGLFDSVNARVVPTGKGNKFKVGGRSQAPDWWAQSCSDCFPFRRLLPARVPWLSA